jgi:hypothetical protein
MTRVGVFPRASFRIDETSDELHCLPEFLLYFAIITFRKLARRGSKKPVAKPVDE